MPTSATTMPTSEKRVSQYKRKPPPSSTLLDLELGDTPHDRYPPFDLDDPFASLTELRRRSRSLSCTLECATASDLHHGGPGTAPFDLPPLSSKAFPSGMQRRYTLTVALPGPLESPTYISSPSEGSVIDYKRVAEREDALAKLTTRVASTGTTANDGSASVSSRSRDASAGRTSHQDHHRRYTHISMLFRAASAAHLPQNGRKGKPTRSHYIPRKASTLSYMYTPPLTPDLSGSSSSSSSLFDPAMMASMADKEAIPPPPRSPTPTTHSFVKKLLTKRSLNVLPPLPRRKESLDAKDLPSLPPTPTEKRVAESAPTIPFPRASVLASMSDVTLPTTAVYFEKEKSTASKIGATPQPSIVFSRLLPSDREVDGYETAPESRLPPGAELDAGLTPPSRKHKLFSFSSRSLLKSRVDIFEAVDETGRKVNRSEIDNVTFDEFALPTAKQLSLASSLHVVSESGVRVRFGDIWEKEKTVVIFIRHFRASACQDYVRSIASEVDVEALKKAGLSIVIVGLGSHSLITPYRQLTGTTFPIYTDTTLAVHRALGMTLRSTNRGSASERGHYIASRGGALGSLCRTLQGATRLPLFERAGDTAQLGGEFVLGPGADSCVYAHRMRTTAAHAPILDVVEASGVQTAGARRVRRMRGSASAEGRERERRVSMEDEDAWMARRRRSLVRLKKKRQRRRVGVDSSSSGSGSGSGDATGDRVKRRSGEKPADASRRRGRFLVVEEEEDEDGDDVYDMTLDIQ